jgi:hypothetical protein
MEMVDETRHAPVQHEVVDFSKTYGISISNFSHSCSRTEKSSNGGGTRG